MFAKQIKYLLLLFLCLNFIKCETEKTSPKSATLSFPVGRVFLNADELSVFIGEQEYQPNIVEDNCGGYWIVIPRQDVPDGDKITIQFFRKKQEIFNYKEELEFKDSWIEPSYYIDSDNELLIEKAVGLTSHFATITEKAERLQRFVSSYMTYNNNIKYTFYKKSSQTLLDREGTCMNMSRLYVGLCRAAGIPARSVWGVISGDFHHQWAEIRDEKGNWHASDFGFTRVYDLNDVRYLDLFYGAEENNFILHRDTTEIMFHNLKYYNDYPVTPSGYMGFKRVSTSTEGMLVEYTYQPGKLNNNLDAN